MSTFLQLCNWLKRDIGFRGSDLTTTASQVGESNKLVQWIKNADLDIQRRHIDWKFLYVDENSASKFSSSLTTSTQNITAPTSPAVYQWDKDSFWINRTASTAQQLDYVDYSEWLMYYSTGTYPSDKPSTFTLRINNDIVLYPKADGSYTLTANYWQEPNALDTATPADTSLIPTRHERIIVVRAKIFYAEEYDAPEVLESASREFADLLNTLEGDQLRDNNYRLMSRGEPMMVKVY